MGFWATENAALGQGTSLATSAIKAWRGSGNVGTWGIASGKRIKGYGKYWKTPFLLCQSTINIPFSIETNIAHQLYIN